MFKSLKIGAALLCLSLALPALASPLGVPLPKRASKHHGHGRTMPGRHNAGRPMHG